MHSDSGRSRFHLTARRISHMADGIICEQRRDECRIAIRLLLGHIRGHERRASFVYACR